MIYINPQTRLPVNTREEPWPRLLGLLRHLHHSFIAKEWVKANGGEGALHRFGVALRIEARLRGKTIGGYYAAILNRMDPPPCRCGRKGTRIIGRETFCRQCGPSATAQKGMHFYAERFEEKARQLEAGHKAFDDQQRKRASLHDVCRTRRGGAGRA